MANIEICPCWEWSHACAITQQLLAIPFRKMPRKTRRIANPTSSKKKTTAKPLPPVTRTNLLEGVIGEPAVNPSSVPFPDDGHKLDLSSEYNPESICPGPCCVWCKKPISCDLEEYISHVQEHLPPGAEWSRYTSTNLKSWYTWDSCGCQELQVCFCTDCHFRVYIYGVCA